MDEDQDQSTTEEQEDSNPSVSEEQATPPTQQPAEQPQAPQIPPPPDGGKLIPPPPGGGKIVKSPPSKPTKLPRYNVTEFRKQFDQQIPPPPGGGEVKFSDDYLQKAADQLTLGTPAKVTAQFTAAKIPKANREDFLQAVHEAALRNKTVSSGGALSRLGSSLVEGIEALGSEVSEFTGGNKLSDEDKKYANRLHQVWSNADPTASVDAPWYEKGVMAAGKISPTIYASGLAGKVFGSAAEALGAGKKITGAAEAAGGMTPFYPGMYESAYDSALSHGASPRAASMTAAVSAGFQSLLYAGVGKDILPASWSKETGAQTIAEAFLKNYTKNVAKGAGMMGAAAAIDETIQQLGTGKPDVMRVLQNSAEGIKQGLGVMPFLAAPKAIGEAAGVITGNVARREPLKMPEEPAKQDKIMAHNFNGSVPSRKEWAELGLDPDRGRSQSQRRDGIRQMADDHFDTLADGIPVQYNIPQTFVDSMERDARSLKPAEGEPSTWEEYLPAEADKPAVHRQFAGFLNGKEVYHVDPKEVNEHFFPDVTQRDFTEGGNNGRYKFIPKHEVWIANNAQGSDLPEWAMHEGVEEHLMNRFNMSYDSKTDKHPIPAHQIANTVEAIVHSKLAKEADAQKQQPQQPEGQPEAKEQKPLAEPPEEPSGAEKLAAGEEGAMDVAKIMEPVNSFGERVKNELFKARAAKDVIAGYEGTQNDASVEALAGKNSVANEMKRTMKAGGVKTGFKKVSPSMEAALPYLREAAAGGGVKYLEKERAKIEGMSEPDEYQLKGINYAIKNYDSLPSVTKKLGDVLDNQYGKEKAGDIEVGAWNAYFPRIWKPKPEYPSLFGGGGGGAQSSFTHERKYETYADAIAAGEKPMGKPLEILEARLSAGNKKLATQAWLEMGRNTPDPQTGKPTVTDPVKDSRGKPVAPRGYSLRTVGSRLVSIHNGYESTYRVLQGESAVREGLAGKALMEYIGTDKQIKTLLDSLHLGKVSIIRTFLNPVEMMTGKASYNRALTALENTPEDIKQMAEDGEISKEALPELLEQNRVMRGMIKEGFNPVRIYDNFASEWIRKLPVFGKVNKFIFDQYQRGAMSMAGYLEQKRVKAMLPELTEKQVWQRVAKELNPRFGQMGRQGLFTSGTGLDMARLITFAPGWLEGLIRSEIGSVTGLAETAKYALQGRLVYNALVKQAVVGLAMSLAGMQILNMASRGHPTWENPEDEPGAKTSAYFSIPGLGDFRLDAMAMVYPIFNQLKTLAESKGNIGESAIELAKNKSGTLGRIAIQAAKALYKTHSTTEALKSAGQEAVSVPIAAKAVYAAGKSIATGKLQEEKKGEIGKQLGSSMGLPFQPQETAEKKMYRKAENFRENYRSPSGLKPQQKPELPEGQYAELNRALQMGDEKRAKDAMDRLEESEEKKNIYQHFGPHYVRKTFTGSRVMDAAFYRSLTPQEKKLFDDAIQERVQVVKKFRELFVK